MRKPLVAERLRMGRERGSAWNDATRYDPDCQIQLGAIGYRAVEFRSLSTRLVVCERANICVSYSWSKCLTLPAL